MVEDRVDETCPTLALMTEYPSMNGYLTSHGRVDIYCEIIADSQRYPNPNNTKTHADKDILLAKKSSRDIITLQHANILYQQGYHTKASIYITTRLAL